MRPEMVRHGRVRRGAVQATTWLESLSCDGVGRTLGSEYDRFSKFDPESSARKPQAELARLGRNSRKESVLFDSVPHPVPVGSEIERFGSIRFGCFGSVPYSILTQIATTNSSAKQTQLMINKQTTRETRPQFHW